MESKRFLNTLPLVAFAVGALALIAALGLAACGGSGSTALRDTAWELESLTGNGLLPDTTITLKFAGDQVSGSAGCNQYGGSYQAGGDSLSVGDVFATEMGCMEPEGIMEQETAYLTALGTAATYQITADRLEMFDEAGAQILVFVTPTGDPTPTP
jgi:heat shock protein HslJ